MSATEDVTLMAGYAYPLAAAAVLAVHAGERPVTAVDLQVVRTRVLRSEHAQCAAKCSPGQNIVRITSSVLMTSDARSARELDFVGGDEPDAATRAGRHPALDTRA